MSDARRRHADLQGARANHLGESAEKRRALERSGPSARAAHDDSRVARPDRRRRGPGERKSLSGATGLLRRRVWDKALGRLARAHDGRAAAVPGRQARRMTRARGGGARQTAQRQVTLSSWSAAECGAAHDAHWLWAVEGAQERHEGTKNRGRRARDRGAEGNPRIRPARRQIATPSGRTGHSGEANLPHRCDFYRTGINDPHSQENVDT